VYGIVEQFSGFIDVRSEPNRGSVFEIYLPSRGQGSLALPPAVLVPAPRGGSETLLLVEDEPQVRQLVLAVLEARGYKVLCAEYGGEAVRVEENHPAQIHLLITDVVMPGMSGRELAEHLLSLRPALKVLFMSGYTDDAVLRHGVIQIEGRIVPIELHIGLIVNNAPMQCNYIVFTPGRHNCQ